VQEGPSVSDHAVDDPGVGGRDDRGGNEARGRPAHQSGTADIGDDAGQQRLERVIVQLVQ
jgi:hypothetical protein